MSEPTVIDTALANAAGTVVKELEPEAITAFDDLKAFVHTQADRLRTALPALEQAATDHIRGVVGAVLGEYENVLGRIDAHLSVTPTGTTVAPGETGTVSNPAVPGQSEPAQIEQTATPATDPVAPAVSAPEGSVQVPAEPTPGA